ncbi:class I SAM-dependent methyltransferase [Symbioplanes lichenis]|uniref:class I SAM-dependent methyltransferase n=1 Tax=Symbioplanes lichenis TaxID=1629072 RepID=UPI0027399E2D|nr:class I SAM-dependent methyltransferase [Actinoplanes lichenis]
MTPDPAPTPPGTTPPGTARPGTSPPGLAQRATADSGTAEPGGAESAIARLAGASLAAGDPTGWFEELYAEAEAGTAEIPWDSDRPSRLLTEWAEHGDVTGAARTALVVGCGPGRDAEYLARLGFVVTAFDISATALRTARRRHPDSPVDYVHADLLALPAAWRGAFDLVVESNNVQALPAAVRPRAIAAIGPLVAPGGTLLVLAAARDEDSPAPGGPPWPLTRTEIDAFAAETEHAGLTTIAVERLADPSGSFVTRWRAEFAAS